MDNVIAAVDAVHNFDSKPLDSCVIKLFCSLLAVGWGRGERVSVTEAPPISSAELGLGALWQNIVSLTVPLCEKGSLLKDALYHQLHNSLSKIQCVMSCFDPMSFCAHRMGDLPKTMKWGQGPGRILSEYMVSGSFWCEVMHLRPEKAYSMIPALLKSLQSKHRGARFQWINLRMSASNILQR